nr:hypothetical protein Iba_chr07bCG13490 [Ipomoea batatas]
MNENICPTSSALWYLLNLANFFFSKFPSEDLKFGSDEKFVAARNKSTLERCGYGTAHGLLGAVDGGGVEVTIAHLYGLNKDGCQLVRKAEKKSTATPLYCMRRERHADGSPAKPPLPSWRLPAMDGVASRLEVVGRSGSFEISDLRSVRAGHHWTLEFRSQISDFGGAAGDLEPWRSTTVGGWH